MVVLTKQQQQEQQQVAMPVVAVDQQPMGLLPFLMQCTVSRWR